MVGDLVLKVGRAMIRVKGKGKGEERRGQKCIEYLTYKMGQEEEDVR